MNPTATPRISVLDTLVDIGPPLLMLVLLSEQTGIGVGALSTIWAAVLSGLAVPVIGRLLILPFLRACQQGRTGLTGRVLFVVCNAGIGAACFVAVVP